ncbi:MAG: 3-deoxy-manno-octulosonate cytidylyltransferase [Calditrichaeota bacterium]|nr:3-deoxy-manno-octulosonate cytidylyltransferase [Calditrichota bacterium]HQU74816.1 3-deoxy-manno-octulosonate cytidylyltransferase [Calditrichia bacterium]
MSKTVVVIPARFQSTRLPGKPLIQLAGKSMIQRVYERASRIALADRVVVATDDQRIVDAVQAFGGEALLTDPNLPTGSERVGAVARDLDCEVVVNLQGDEPLIDPGAVEKGIDFLYRHPQAQIATLASPLTREADWQNPAVVKVLTDQNDKALYFSRSPIPYHREASFQPLPNLFRHIGVYIFRRDFLLEYLTWPESGLENREKLEQLRILERGVPIYVLECQSFSPGVDVPEDVKTVEHLITSKGMN